jgi:hypothetical protein
MTWITNFKWFNNICKYAKFTWTQQKIGLEIVSRYELMMLKYPKLEEAIKESSVFY